MDIKVKKLDKSEVEITGKIEASVFAGYEDKALAKINDRIELPGFRKGKAPIEVIKKNVPEMELLEEMAEAALYDNYMKILEDNKIDAIGRPQISITKIGKGSDLEFKIVTAVLPEIKLGDYKKIASKENSKEENKKEIVVEDAEVEKVINDLRKMRAEQARPAHEHKEGETEEEHAAHHQEIPESEWPKFDDEFAKTFGDFKTAEELKEKIKGNLKVERTTEQKDKIRLAIIEELVKQSEGEIPDILVQSEIDKIIYKLEGDITNVGFKFEDYLKQIGKTLEDLRKEFHADAEKRAKLQMIIHTISEKEKLQPTEEEIEKDVTQITAMYKEADPVRARAYVEQMLENEKVFKFLDEQ
jgi:trigger factor